MAVSIKIETGAASQTAFEDNQSILFNTHIPPSFHAHVKPPEALRRMQTGRSQLLTTKRPERRLVFALYT
jgi:hypothetical protein